MNKQRRHFADHEKVATGPGQQESTDPWTYIPCYQGEYEKEGKLRRSDDPYRFWVIPIIRWPKCMKVKLVEEMPRSLTGEYDVHDYLEKHACLDMEVNK